jgi:hypothetical protein
MNARPDRLIFVKMKARRADEHFQSLEREMAKWAAKPYTIIEKTNFEKALHIVSIEITHTPEIIAMLFSDFISNLRSTLDQLAWKLAHLPPVRTFNRTEERQIHFPIFETRNATYEDRRALFPPAVAEIIDTFQPYLRRNAFRDDPLWQLNELWTLDKHRNIPTAPYELSLGFPSIPGWERFVRRNGITYDLDVAFPIALAFDRSVNLKPDVSVEILFGETGILEITLSRLREINNFVRNEVIPRFMGFFPESIDSN